MITRTLCLCFIIAISPAQAQADSNTLTIGRVSTNPKENYQDLKGIVDYAASKMHDLGITQGKVVFAANNRQMIKYLREGKVDWVGETVFSGLLFEKEAGAQIILRRWKKGVPTYRTVFITHKNSSIRKLSDLSGKTIAFEDPGSTSAYFMPVAEMVSSGLQLSQLKSHSQRVPDGKVGYLFTKSEINISTWVHRRRVDAGAYSNLNWQNDKDTPKHSKSSMRIFHQTGEMPRAVEIVRKDLPPKIIARLQSILLESHNKPNAKSVLKGYGKTSKFDRIDQHSSSSMKEARHLFKAMQKELMK